MCISVISTARNLLVLFKSNNQIYLKGGNSEMCQIGVSSTVQLPPGANIHKMKLFPAFTGTEFYSFGV